MSDKQKLHLQYCMSHRYRDHVFRLWDQTLTAIDAFDPDGALPVMIARARAIFDIAHPEPECAAWFPFRLVRCTPPDYAITNYRLEIAPPPARFSLGLLFMVEAVQQALEPTQRPNFVDLNLILDDFMTLASSPEPALELQDAAKPETASRTS